MCIMLSWLYDDLSAAVTHTGPQFTKKTPSYWNRDPYYKCDTVNRPSQVYNSDSYIHKTVSFS